MNTRLAASSLASLALLAGVASIAAHAGPTASSSLGGAREDDLILVNRDKNALALQGYDPVAYFTLGSPTRGDERFSARHQGAVYHFANAEHRDLFEADPERYAPAYGGYCGYAASINRLSPIDPDFWQIVDGRLVLQHNQRAFDRWNADVPDNARKADANWPTLVARNGAAEKVLINTDDDGIALQGYDPVTYFTDAQPSQGSADYTAVYNGATYRFVSMDNRVTFETDPARYAPAFGGYCGYAASIKKVSPVNPLIYQIIDGRLVLQHTDEAYRLFNKDANASLVRADRNWPGLVQRKGK